MAQRLKKKSTCQCRRHGFDPWVGKIPWQRKWQPTPVFLPGESHGQRSLVGHRSCKLQVHRVAKSRTQLSNLAHKQQRNTNTQNSWFIAGPWGTSVTQLWHVVARRPQHPLLGLIAFSPQGSASLHLLLCVLEVKAT